VALGKDIKRQGRLNAQINPERLTRNVDVGTLNVDEISVTSVQGDASQLPRVYAAPEKVVGA